MGANGSRCDHYAVDHFHRRRLQKTRSMSTAEYHSTNIGFFPPPILHNLYPELDNNPMIAKEFGGSVTNVVGEHRAEMLLVDMVLTKAANRSSHENIVAKTSSASVVSNNTNGSCSSSSGCESSVSDDNLENYFDQQQQLSSSSSLLAAKPVKCPGKQRLRLYTPRSRGHYGRSKRASIDSGTGCDDDDNNLNSGGAVGASGSSRTIITKRRSVSLCIPHSGSLSLEKNSDEADDTSFGDAVSSAVSAKHESKNSISSNDGSNPNHSYDCDDLNDGDDDDCVNARAVDARLSRRSISMSSCYPQNNSGSATDVANASKLSANSKMRSCGQLPLATAATAAAAADDGLVGDKKKRKKRSKSISKSLKNLRMRAFSLGAISSDEFKRKST
uniref:Suppressor protein SRP40-like n=1 Tax=Syphacia muris TaxID=451379 RepID=A0A0N5A9E6_9BILA